MICDICGTDTDSVILIEIDRHTELDACKKCRDLMSDFKPASGIAIKEITGDILVANLAYVSKE